MKINEELLCYLEELSRLTLNDMERIKAMKDLTNILALTEQLQALQTGDVPALSHPFHYVNAFRDDVVINSSNPFDILKNAPESRNTYFKVQKTVD